MHLKTLFNIVEAPFKILLNFDVCAVWWCSDGPINSQEYTRFEIHAVSIKISMTEYHHWINGLLTIYAYTTVYGEKWVWYFWSLAYFCFFEALTSAFEVQFFQGFIFTPYQRHWWHEETCSSDFFKSENIVKQMLLKVWKWGLWRWKWFKNGVGRGCLAVTGSMWQLQILRGSSGVCVALTGGLPGTPGNSHVDTVAA